ncbi:NAD(P)H dehydrogenase [Hydrogenophaga sp. Root209]|uniref:FMN-dependent NADH-azoreductase n=1 Tax=unclassified Hydrogenophaga TaxID=2610897 RepID=UPI0006F72CE2|nr:NAD(P)H-dependent oxidoreductase [Hydrogenophaga sp. Root209]KRB97710.1 NAD(P)H dehydrogenase [Hydrogenophaga sp. Root209]
MKILHVSCSPRGPSAESDRLSRRIIAFLQRGAPDAVVVERFVGGGALPHVDDRYATALGATHATEDTMTGSMARSEELIQELEAADAVVIATPMHNFTVPSALKAWIDHIVRVRRTFHVSREGKHGTLRNRPVFVAVSSGGVFSGERARQPDFLTPYLKAILATVGLHDIMFFSVQGTGQGPDALVEARARTDRALRAHFDPVAAREDYFLV